MIGVEAVKSSIEALKGKRLGVYVNKGRKKVLRYEGEISDVYPSLFTVRLYDDTTSSLTASYSDVLTGDVKLKLLK